MTRRGQLNWLDIQRDWTQGDATVRAIGQKHGVSHARISQRAKAESWGERKGGSSNPPKRGGVALVSYRKAYQATVSYQSRLPMPFASPPASSFRSSSDSGRRTDRKPLGCASMNTRGT